jgi:hypothetical protein
MPVAVAAAHTACKRLRRLNVNFVCISLYTFIARSAMLVSQASEITGESGAKESSQRLESGLPTARIARSNHRLVLRRNKFYHHQRERSWKNWFFTSTRGGGSELRRSNIHTMIHGIETHVA